MILWTTCINLIFLTLDTLELPSIKEAVDPGQQQTFGYWQVLYMTGHNRLHSSMAFTEATKIQLHVHAC
jgi:hypothetical protein